MAGQQRPREMMVELGRLYKAQDKILKGHEKLMRGARLANLHPQETRQTNIEVTAILKRLEHQIEKQQWLAGVRPWYRQVRSWGTCGHCGKPERHIDADWTTSSRLPSGRVPEPGELLLTYAVWCNSCGKFELGGEYDPCRSK